MWPISSYKYTHDETTFLGTMMCVQECHDEYLPKLICGVGWCGGVLLLLIHVIKQVNPNM
jgi:hypothetical protein